MQNGCRAPEEKIDMNNIKWNDPVLELDHFILFSYRISTEQSLDIFSKTAVGVLSLVSKPLVF